MSHGSLAGATRIVTALAVTVGWQWSLVFIGILAAATLVLAGRGRSAWDADRQPGGAGARFEPFGGVPLVWRQESLRWVAHSPGSLR